MSRRAPTAFLDRIQETIRRHGMLSPGDRVAVGVSGGPDSVALLAALAELAPALHLELCAFHFNHGLRPEAGLDQECAETVAASLGVPCVTGHAESLEPGGNLEARAREQRYAFFVRAAAAGGWTRIATAHTADDQAETVLMRLLRGSGSGGLAGIPPVRHGTIVRPLLACRREEVLNFLAARGLPYRVDSSNADCRHLRNRVRREVLPFLEAINPRVRETLAATSEIMAAESNFLDLIVRTLLPPPGAADAVLEVRVVCAADTALRPRLVREWLRRARGDLQQIEAVHVQSVVGLATGSRTTGAVPFPRHARVVREYGVLRFAGASAAQGGTGDGLLWPGTALRFGSAWEFAAGLLCGGPICWRLPADLREFMADAQVLSGPLVVRRARPGDRIQPLGMRGHRKLQDVFVDRKIAAGRRWTFPVLEAGGRVLWVPGIVRSGHALVGASTRAALRIRTIAAP